MRRDGVQSTHSRRHRRARVHDDGAVPGKADEGNGKRERQPVAGTKRVFVCLFCGIYVGLGRRDTRSKRTRNRNNVYWRSRALVRMPIAEDGGGGGGGSVHSHPVVFVSLAPPQRVPTLGCRPVSHRSGRHARVATVKYNGISILRFKCTFSNRTAIIIVLLKHYNALNVLRKHYTIRLAHYNSNKNNNKRKM